MANGDFRQDLNPTNDPNYIRHSKEPDRIKPLELVSVPASNISDTRFGALLQGAGTLVDLSSSAFSQYMGRQIIDAAHAAIDPVQDQHGSSLQPSDVQPIAGTGAKGRARLQSSQQQNLFGSPETSALPYNDPMNANAELPAEIARPLPASAQIELDRVSRMNTAYQNGTMSDSYYNAQLVSTTKELRARFPGFRDEVDAAVSQITGVQPANALRKSLLSDLNANAAARATGASDFEKQLTKNATSITEIVPDFFANRTNYAGKETSILQQAYQLDAERARVTANTQRLTLDKSNVAMTMTDVAATEVRAGLARVNNWVDPQDGKTINQKLNELSKSGGGTPEQLAGITNTLENMKRQLTQGINAAFTDPTRGAGGKTLAAIGGRENSKAALEQALEPIDAMIAQVKTGNVSMLKVVTDRLDLSKSAEAQRQIDSNPAVKYISGLDKAGGQVLTGYVLQGTQLLPAFQKAITEDKILQTAVSGKNGTPVPGLTTQLEDMKKAGIKVDGPVLTAVVKGNMELMKHDALGPEVNAAAVRNLYDQKFFAGLPEGEQFKTFQWMSKPENTERITQLDKQSPGLMQQYASWSKYAASVVTSKGIAAARDAASDDRFDIGFNPKTLQITMEPKPGMLQKAGARGTSIGEAYVREVNQTLRTLAPIFKAQGADPVEAIQTWLGDMDVRTKSVGGTTNPVTNKVSQVIRQMFLGPDTEPHQTRGVIKGNLSDEVITGMTTQ